MQGAGQEVLGTFPEGSKELPRRGPVYLGREPVRRMPQVAQGERAYITRSRRGLAVSPGVRPLFATGLPSISRMSAVKSLGRALAM